MTPARVPAVQVTGLRKSFKDQIVLDGIDLEIAPGTVFALLGPNGAGKTTTVQILATLLPPDAGEVQVGGFDLARHPAGVRRSIGVTGQFSAVDTILSGEQNLQLMADLNHLPKAEGQRRAAELLERFDLADAARKPVAAYSGGMRRRLDLAMTLIGEPRIIFLDEPTTGLDPRSRRTMWQIIRELVGSGITILLTTQDLDEADQLADRIAFLDHGHLVAEGTPGELKRRIPGGHAQLEFRTQAALAAAAQTLGEGAADDEALVLRVPVDQSLGALVALQQRLGDLAPSVERLTVHTPDLDDVFFALTASSSQTTLPPTRQPQEALA